VPPRAGTWAKHGDTRRLKTQFFPPAELIKASKEGERSSFVYWFILPSRENIYFIHGSWLRNFFSKAGHRD
jgi:hypothetical protein